jgi:hypothetical protein
MAPNNEGEGSNTPKTKPDPLGWADVAIALATFGISVAVFGWESAVKLPSLVWTGIIALLSMALFRYLIRHSPPRDPQP